MTRTHRLCTITLLGALMVLLCTTAFASTTFKAVSAFPTQVQMTQQFLQFVKQVNSDKSLGVDIRFLGGPEVIPPQQQAQAVQNHVVDMIYGPANYYFSQVPEGEALVASTIDAVQARKDGGLALLDSIYEKKLNAHLLGWFGSGTHFFHIYTVNKPNFTSSGKIAHDVRIRSVQLYRGLLNGMGMIPISVQVPNVYTALQRGVVDGVAWPLIGITDLSWNHFLRYRINPGFFNNTTIVLVNQTAWKHLSKEQRTRLQALANAFEKTSMQEFAVLSAKIRHKVTGQGMQPVVLKGAALARYMALARTVPWKSMERLHGSHLAQLKADFAPADGK